MCITKTFRPAPVLVLTYSGGPSAYFGACSQRVNTPLSVKYLASVSSERHSGSYEVLFSVPYPAVMFVIEQLCRVG